MTAASTGASSRMPAATAAGRPDTRLVVIRGNSASGKPSVAQSLRDHYGRGIAIVGHDVIRRNVLREHDTARGADSALLATSARAAFDAGFHVVLGQILYADRYGHTITSLVRDHRGVSGCYYLDVPLEATLVRHAPKADAAHLAHVTEARLTSWYRELDLLPGGLESVVPADSTLPGRGGARSRRARGRLDSATRRACAAAGCRPAARPRPTWRARPGPPMGRWATRADGRWFGPRVRRSWARSAGGGAATPGR